MRPFSSQGPRVAGLFRPVPPRGGRAAIAASALLLVLLGGAEPADAASLAGTARIDGFATSDLFPGGETEEAARGLRVLLVPELELRPAASLRVRPWAGIEIERYPSYVERNAESFEFGADLRRSHARLRLAYGFTNDELYFPDPAGDALVDRRHAAIEYRHDLGRSIRAHGGLERATNTFDPLHAERDDVRWTTRLGIERSEQPARRFALTWLYRDTRSKTDLYSYGQNLLRLDAEGRLVGRLQGVTRLEGGLRTYQTGDVFASNFARQDNRWRAFFQLRHPLSGPVRAELALQWRQTGSTRDGKDSVVRGIGLGLVYER